MSSELNRPIGAGTAVIDRIVDQNNALWELLKSDGRPRAERMDLLKRAFPGAKVVTADDALDSNQWIVATGAAIARLRKEPKQ